MHTSSTGLLTKPTSNQKLIKPSFSKTSQEGMAKSVGPNIMKGTKRLKQVTQVKSLNCGIWGPNALIWSWGTSLPSSKPPHLGWEMLGGAPGTIAPFIGSWLWRVSFFFTYEILLKRATSCKHDVAAYTLGGGLRKYQLTYCFSQIKLGM